jgi:hypothetical protein
VDEVGERTVERFALVPDGTTVESHDRVPGPVVGQVPGPADEPDLDVCPHCRKLISEEAERCHHCGNYIRASDAPLSKPAWIVITAIGALLLFLLFWVL